MSNNIARHWIDGAWVTSDRVSPSINPSDGEILGRFADGGAKEASAAISAARRAFDTGTCARRKRSLAPSDDFRQLERPGRVAS
jgi:acyl-CoA reductase-like NAD-dependent aldehyde dehydrogenase